MTTLWDGAGNVVRTDGTRTGVQVWQDARDAGTKIKAQDHDTHDEGLADSIEDCLNRNGENAMAANIAAGGFKFTGVGDAAARDQWLSAAQYQDGGVNWVDSGGTVDAITATYTPNVTALVDGMLLGFRATGANTSTTPTFKAGTTTAHTITKNGAQALAAGDIPRDSYECFVRYRASDTSWELLNPVGASTAGFLSNVVEDTTPQLGGNLDPNGHGIAFTGATVTDVTGADTTLVSGTAGTSGNLASWNVDGDLVDAGATTATVNPFGTALLHVRDEKATTTQGGTFTSGAWQTRTLGTSKTNEISGASLGSNQITLPAGTYFVEAWATGYRVNSHQTRLYNTTDTATILAGSNEANDNSSNGSRSTVRGRFTLAAQKVLELQHRCSTTFATSGFGLANSFGEVEVYADVVIWKIS